MKKLLVIFFCFQMLAIFTSCSKEKRLLLNSTWEVEYITSGSTVMRPRDFYKPPYIVPIPGLFLATLLINFTYTVPNQLSFDTDESFVFVLENNVVRGVVKIGKKNEIDFQIKSGEQSSTNKFTITSTNLLENVSRYKADGDNLVLTGIDGKIHLKKIKK